MLTGSTSDRPWSRPTDKRCVFMKNRPASRGTTVTINKAACMLPQSQPSLCLTICLFAEHQTGCIVTLSVFLHSSPAKSSSRFQIYWLALQKICFSALKRKSFTSPGISPQFRPQCLLQLKQRDASRRLHKTTSEHAKVAVSAFF